jgi:2-hydroxychromene-2-carboxylate isomerase
VAPTRRGEASADGSPRGLANEKYPPLSAPSGSPRPRWVVSEDGTRVESARSQSTPTTREARLAKQFEDQGGASSMDPPAPLRWAMSKVIRRMMRPAAVKKRRAKAERKRRKAGLPHRVEYFHQIDDGYSHLAAQLLRPLLESYDVELVCHLVVAEQDKNLPEPELLLALSRRDAACVAPHYGLQFPSEAESAGSIGSTGSADPEQVAVATRILCAVEATHFPEAAVAVGSALWAGDSASLEELAARYGSADPASAEARLASGTERRAKQGHYSGAMFYYGGEWYWGADRFYHLENRLRGHGVQRDTKSELICPRPAIEAGPRKDNGSLTLEIYPSVRSPYTSFIFDLALKLADDTGVRKVVRPVLPMVMRGVPATRQKGFYIFSDSAREAAALGLDWGRMYDPIGQPARNCYALYPWACSQGKGAALISCFLRAAFFDGVNTNNDKGMRHVVEQAGLSFEEARAILDSGSTDWQDELESNRLAMYDFGCWGVPSFRLLDASGNPVLALWGQDRLWLFAREIQRLLAERDASQD